MRVFQVLSDTANLGLSPAHIKGEPIMALLAVNVRNQLRGVVKNILWGDVVSEVEVETSSGVVTSVITTRSIKELSIDIGTEVFALVKATDVAIARV